MENSLFVFLLKTAAFLSKAVQLHPMYPISYVTGISQNYIPLSYPHYIHHQTKHKQKMDKPMIYVMIGSEANMIILKRAHIIHKCINAETVMKNLVC